MLVQYKVKVCVEHLLMLLISKLTLTLLLLYMWSLWLESEQRLSMHRLVVMVTQFTCTIYCTSAVGLCVITTCKLKCDMKGVQSTFYLQITHT